MSGRDNFETVTLRRSTGLMRWKTPNVIDGSDAKRAAFVRVAHIVQWLRRESGYCHDSAMARNMLELADRLAATTCSYEHAEGMLCNKCGHLTATRAEASKESTTTPGSEATDKPNTPPTPTPKVEDSVVEVGGWRIVEAAPNKHQFNWTVIWPDGGEAGFNKIEDAAAYVKRERTER